MTTTLAPIQELQRFPSPAPAPQALACDGPHLWMGSRDTERIYAIDIHTGAVTEENAAPGKPWGAVVVGDELRVTIGQGPDDDRYIRRYVFAHGFKKNDTIACPDFTGSYLGWDGRSLYLSQFYKGLILTLDGTGNVTHTLDVGAHICGFTFAEGELYVLRGDEKTCDWRIAHVALRGGAPEITDLATIPFQCRSLTYDGSRFWTNDREASTLVAFAQP
jgi:hypothetical protein